MRRAVVCRSPPHHNRDPVVISVLGDPFTITRGDDEKHTPSKLPSAVDKLSTAGLPSRPPRIDGGWRLFLKTRLRVASDEAMDTASEFGPWSIGGDLLGGQGIRPPDWSHPLDDRQSHTVQRKAKRGREAVGGVSVPLRWAAPTFITSPPEHRAGMKRTKEVPLPLWAYCRHDVAAVWSVSHTS
eukprot:Sspe_Gene.88158::Locus_60240_Transcript_1_1_Confidence_1.000_Length_980::g.88158::m.88158